MPVVSCKRQFGGASMEAEPGQKRKYTFKWIVQTSTATMDPYQVLKQCIAFGSSDGNSPVPDLYDTLPGDNSARCKRINATQRTEDPKVWDVTVNADTEINPREENRQENENPMQQTVEYSLEQAQFVRVVEKSIDGKPCVNTLGDPFVPAIEQEDYRPVLVAQKNFATLAEVIGYMLEFKDAVNNAPFYGAKRRQARVKSITAGQQQFQNGYYYYPVTIRIEFKSDNDPAGGTWDREVLNTGKRWRKKKGDQNFTNKHDGITPSDAIPLDKDGVPCTKDEAGRLENPHYLTFKTFPERNFGRLGI
jgi:hypothetical protein